MSYNPQNPNGQANKANSAPVVIASDQDALPITDNSGSLTVDQGTATNLKTQAENYQGGAAVASGNPLEVNVRSTTGSSLATSTKQSDGSQKTQVVDGSGNVVGSTSNALDVNIKSNAAANQSTNVAQVGGTAVDTNSGAKSAGTQRVVIATDQPQLTNALKVDGSAVTQPVSGTVTANAGTGNFDQNLKQVNGTSIVTGGVNGSQSVGGPTASGSSLTANPVTIGGLAKTANPTAVSDGQVVNTLHTKTGKLVSVGSLREMIGNQQTTITSSTSETTIVTADATYLLDLYGLILTNTSTTFTKVTIKDSTAGTTRMVIAVPGQDTRGFMLPVDSGHKQATVNNNWTATCGTSVNAIEITALFAKRL